MPGATVWIGEAVFWPIHPSSFWWTSPPACRLRITPALSLCRHAVLTERDPRLETTPTHCVRSGQCGPFNQFPSHRGQPLRPIHQPFALGLVDRPYLVCVQALSETKLPWDSSQLRDYRWSFTECVLATIPAASALQGPSCQTVGSIMMKHSSITLFPLSLLLPPFSLIPSQQQKGPSVEHH